MTLKKLDISFFNKERRSFAEALPFSSKYVPTLGTFGLLDVDFFGSHLGLILWVENLDKHVSSLNSIDFNIGHFIIGLKFTLFFFFFVN